MFRASINPLDFSHFQCPSIIRIVHLLKKEVFPKSIIYNFNKLIIDTFFSLEN